MIISAIKQSTRSIDYSSDMHNILYLYFLLSGQTQVFDSICIYCGDNEVVGDDNHEISRLKNDNAIVRPICASCMNSGLKIITRNAKKK